MHKTNLLLGGCVLLAHSALAATYNVGTTADFQNALNASAPGDTIVLTAGVTFSGNFVLPQKTGTGWITIQSSALASLPPAGTRVTPAYSQYMPKIVSPSDSPGLATANGAHHYRIVGIEFHPTAGVYPWGIVAASYGNETDVSMLAHDLEFDRVYIHGDPTVGAKQGIILNSASTTIKNSYISDIKSTIQEAHGIQGWNGPGPYHIINNYIEASTENIMFGGATAAIANMVPSDIEIRQNYFTKQIAWKSNPSWWVKNLLELKNARRVVVDGNMFEYSWQNQQNGAAILFTVRTETGAMPWAVVEDITFTHNWIRHAGQGIVISGYDDNPVGEGIGHRMLIANNVFEDINAATWGGPGYLFELVHPTQDIIMNHNTAFQSGAALMMLGTPPELRTVFENNIVQNGGGAIGGSGAGIGTSALNAYVQNWIATNNLIVGASAGSYPPNNFFPPQTTDVGFTNASASNYLLASSSAYKGVATDGTDPGADINALNAALANVTTSSSVTAPVSVIGVLPIAAALTGPQTQQFSAVVDGTTTNTAVTWSVSPSLGSISSTGLYTAPSGITALTAVNVIATSAADPSKSGTAEVMLLPGAGSPPPAVTSVRVNAGGSAYTDGAGNVWSADSGYSAGSATYSTGSTISGTTTPTLYQTERWSSGTLQYQFNVANGSYNVNLKFAEIYFTAAGQRVFNIVINGQTVQSSFDIVAAAGGAQKAIDKSYPVNVTNGQITIQLVSVVSNPKISAIEIVQGSSTTTPPPASTALYRVHAGGGAYTDSLAQSWSADTDYSANSSTYATTSAISGTSDPGLYQSERWSSSTLQYTFPATNGTYTVNLKFAEIYFSAAGQRVFNIVINGQTVQSNFDIVAAAGGAFKAISKSYPVSVTNGQIAIQFVPVVSNPKVSAIEILVGGTVATSSSNTVVRVNAGGGGYTDPSGHIWSADTGYNGGSTYTVGATIANTPTQVLYQSERWSSSTLQYSFPVTNGTYTVNLKFAENYFNAAGYRIFNIVINGQTVQSSFDIAAAAGAAYTAIDKSYSVNVTTGQIVIQLVPVVSNPKIDAIEIF